MFELVHILYRSFQQARAPVTKAAPTFEDLTIDDNLSEQQRVVRYTKSTIGLQRYACFFISIIVWKTISSCNFIAYSGLFMSRKWPMLLSP